MHPWKPILVAAALLLPAIVARAEEVALLPEREDWLTIAELVEDGNALAAAGHADPLLAPMLLCENQGCGQTGWQGLSASESATLRALFATDGDAAAERDGMGHAIARLETMMGARNGTWRDRPANQHDGEGEDANDSGQLDCVAEAINTRTYLDRLTRAGLLRHHHVVGFIHRYTIVLQHVAVEIAPDDDSEHFAVDSWVGANGEPPEIVPYADWRWEWGV